jgi:hypothetical protein
MPAWHEGNLGKAGVQCDLDKSIWRAARDYCARHFGTEWTGGRARGLGLRFQAALAGK